MYLCMDQLLGAWLHSKCSLITGSYPWLVRHTASFIGNPMCTGEPPDEGVYIALASLQEGGHTLNSVNITESIPLNRDTSPKKFGYRNFTFGCINFAFGYRNIGIRIYIWIN